MGRSELCLDCGKQSPETETDYTLISSQFGWRLTRKKTAEGELLLEWRCPTCWAAQKRKQPEVSSADSETHSPPGSRRRSSKA